MRDSLKKAQANYNKKCRVIVLRINKEAEPEIIQWLERGRVATRIKQLIKQDIKNNPLT